MQLVTQENYKEPEDPTKYDGVALVVHRRKGSVSPIGLVIFVHGLTGKRYGYWHNIPKFTCEACPRVRCWTLPLSDGVQTISIYAID